MSSHCVSCGGSINSGARVLQLAYGNYCKGSLTPTYSAPIVAEWHENCFSAFELNWQTHPYCCLICNESLSHGAAVAYITTGTKPRPGFTRPECRGCEIPYIVHRQCFEEDDGL
jgi:hypothetical protein